MMETEAEKPPSPEIHPFLFYRAREDMVDQTLVSFSNQVSSYRLYLPELEGRLLWTASASGWCLLSNDWFGGDFLLWNSLTSDKITLPSLHLEEEETDSALSGSPPDPDFKVLLMLGNSPSIMLYNIGAHQWRVIDYKSEFIRCFGDQDVRDGHIRFAKSICFKGKLYFISTQPISKRFVVEGFDSDSVAIELLDINDPVFPQYASSSNEEYLVELDGVIDSVFIQYGVDDDELIAVHLQRFDFLNKSWVKIENAPHLAFFLWHNSSFCCGAAASGVKGNRVYFFMTDEQNVHEYDIGDGTLSLHRHAPGEDVPYMFPFWIMFDERLVSRSDEVKNGDSILKAHGHGSVNRHAREKESQCNNMLLEGKDVGKMIYCHLRPDVAESVGDYLSPIDYLQFRATCRTCRSILPLIRFKGSLLRTLKTADSLSPLLVFLERGNLGAFIDPVRGDKYLMTFPPQLSGCVIASSKDGYLLVSGRGLNDKFIFNPFAWKLLPLAQTRVQEYGIDTEIYCVGFSSSPTSDYSFVTAFRSLNDVCVTFADSGSKGCRYYRFANDSWFCFCHNSPVFYNGAFHFLDEHGFMGILRPVGNGFAWEVYKPTKTLSSYKQKFLLECDGKLISVCVSFFQKQVQVCRWDSSTSTWVRVHSLGKHMIYVSNASSISMIAGIPGMENKVYFPRLCGQSIVFYSLDTERFHTFESKDLEIDVYDTREQLRACWIAPTWH